jgi:hypothetical protein
VGSLRLSVPHAYPGLRLNVVCPSMTLTGMVAGIKDGWMAIGAPVNQPTDIANFIAGIAVSGQGREAIKYSELAARQMGGNAGGMNWEQGAEWKSDSCRWRRLGQQEVNESKRFDGMFQ